jgi:hypothetical protein
LHVSNHLLRLDFFSTSKKCPVTGKKLFFSRPIFFSCLLPLFISNIHTLDSRLPTAYFWCFWTNLTIEVSEAVMKREDTYLKSKNLIVLLFCMYGQRLFSLHFPKISIFPSCQSKLVEPIWVVRILRRRRKKIFIFLSKRLHASERRAVFSRNSETVSDKSRNQIIFFVGICKSNRGIHGKQSKIKPGLKR